MGQGQLKLFTRTVKSSPLSPENFKWPDRSVDGSPRSILISSLRADDPVERPGHDGKEQEEAFAQRPEQFQL